MSGLKYLLKISAIVLLLVIFAVVGARGCGLSQRYAPHPHPLTELPQPWVFMDMADFGLDPFLSKFSDPSEIPFWTVEIGDLSKSELWSDIEKFVAQERVFALYLPENEMGFSEELAARLIENGLQERAVLISPHDGLLRDLRAHMPEAMFSLGQGAMTQLFLLHSFFLEPLARFKSDLLLMGPEFLSPSGQIPLRLLRELRRRHKVVVLDLRQINKENFLPIQSDGYLLDPNHPGSEILRTLRRKGDRQRGR